MSQIERGVCRVCGCTETSPCFNPKYGYCWWADDIAPALEGLCGHGFDSMHRYSSIPNHNHEELVESIERYTVKLVQE